MKDLVCGVCGEIISNPSSPCPYCGAEPNHFIPAEGVDRELLRKLCREGRTDLLTGAASPPAKPAVSGFPPGDSGFRRDGLDIPGPRTAPPGLKPRTARGGVPPLGAGGFPRAVAGRPFGIGVLRAGADASGCVRDARRKIILTRCPG
jgi:hypothetical protein